MLYADVSKNESNVASLTAALPHLSNLTTLCLFVDALEVIPPGITALRHLQRLLIDNYGAPGNASSGVALPGGPWLASLRWLGLPWAALEASSGGLDGTSQLEYVCSLGLPYASGNADDVGSNHDRWRVFWQFVGSHQPLKCLAVEARDNDTPSMFLFDEVLILKQRRPHLQLRRITQGSFFIELEAESIPSGTAPSSRT